MLGSFAIVCPSVPAFTVAVIVSVIAEPPFNVPTFHTPVEPSYVPMELVQETSESPAPNISVTVTCVEVVNAGAPVNVYVIVSPTAGLLLSTVSASAVAMEQVPNVVVDVAVEDEIGSVVTVEVVDVIVELDVVTPLTLVSSLALELKDEVEFESEVELAIAVAVESALADPPFVDVAVAVVTAVVVAFTVPSFELALALESDDALALALTVVLEATTGVEVAVLGVLVLTIGVVSVLDVEDVEAVDVLTLGPAEALAPESELVLPLEVELVSDD
jgi:hypothetical protein